MSNFNNEYKSYNALTSPSLQTSNIYEDSNIEYLTLRYVTVVKRVEEHAEATSYYKRVIKPLLLFPQLISQDFIPSEEYRDEHTFPEKLRRKPLPTISLKDLAKYEIKDIEKKKKIIETMLKKPHIRLDVGMLIKIAKKLYIGINDEGKPVLYIEED